MKIPEIPLGYRSKDGEIFPGLEKSLLLLNSHDETAMGNLIIVCLGGIPLSLHKKQLDRNAARYLVGAFNQRTGATVKLARDGSLSYPGLEIK